MRGKCSPRAAQYQLHAITDTSGRPIRFLITARQVSDYTGAAALMSGLPEAKWLPADRGYDAYWFREALIDKGTKPCIPGYKSRKKTIRYDTRRYIRRNRIERMFGRLKDWRRISPAICAAMSRQISSASILLKNVSTAALKILYLSTRVFQCF
jgi:transposase